MDNIFIRQEKVKLTFALKAIVTQNVDRMLTQQHTNILTVKYSFKVNTNLFRGHQS